MESGPPTPDRPRDPESPGPDPGPQSPAPPPPGPQAPPSGPQAPPAPGPEGPGGLPKAPPAPEGPAYGGPVPPGGWDQPIGQAPHVFAGAELSGWWRRVGAQVLDSLILTIPVALIVVLVVVVAAGSDVGAIVMKRPGAHNGQTWGRQALAIRVVHDTGEEVTFGYAFVREVLVKYLLFNFIGSFFFSIPTILDYLWPLWDDENRCLHDMIVKSHVVRT